MNIDDFFNYCENDLDPVMLCDESDCESCKEKCKERYKMYERLHLAKMLTKMNKNGCLFDDGSRRRKHKLIYLKH